MNIDFSSDEAVGVNKDDGSSICHGLYRPIGTAIFGRYVPSVFNGAVRGYGRLENAIPCAFQACYVVATASGLILTAQNTPVISRAIPSSVIGSGSLPRRMKA